MLQWYLIHTHPKQEGRADGNLRAWRIETFTPMLRERCYNGVTKAKTHRIKPLFYCYIFARFDITNLYHKIRFTRGVNSVVSCGNVPTPVSEEVIQLIRAKVDAGGYVNLEEPFETGDEIIIRDEPLQILKGIFQGYTKDDERVRILLNAVSYQAHVAIDRALVDKC